MRVSLPQFRGNRRCTREDHNANDTRTDDPPNRKPAGTLGPLGYVNVGVKCWPWEQESSNSAGTDAVPDSHEHAHHTREVSAVPKHTLFGTLARGEYFERLLLDDKACCRLRNGAWERGRIKPIPWHLVLAYDGHCNSFVKGNWWLDALYAPHLRHPAELFSRYIINRLWSGFVDPAKLSL